MLPFTQAKAQADINNLSGTINQRRNRDRYSDSLKTAVENYKNKLKAYSDVVKNNPDNIAAKEKLELYKAVRDFRTVVQKEYMNKVENGDADYQWKEVASQSLRDAWASAKTVEKNLATHKADNEMEPRKNVINDYLEYTEKIRKAKEDPDKLRVFRESELQNLQTLLKEGNNGDINNLPPAQKELYDSLDRLNNALKDPQRDGFLETEYLDVYEKAKAFRKTEINNQNQALKNAKDLSNNYISKLDEYGLRKNLESVKTYSDTLTDIDKRQEVVNKAKKALKEGEKDLQKQMQKAADEYDKNEEKIKNNNNALDNSIKAYEEKARKKERLRNSLSM